MYPATVYIIIIIIINSRCGEIFLFLRKTLKIAFYLLWLTRVLTEETSLDSSSSLSEWFRSLLRAISRVFFELPEKNLWCWGSVSGSSWTSDNNDNTSSSSVREASPQDIEDTSEWILPALEFRPSEGTPSWRSVPSFIRRSNSPSRIWRAWNRKKIDVLFLEILKKEVQNIKMPRVGKKRDSF